MGYIYLIKNKLNNKQYICQTQQLDINKRWKQHKTIMEYEKVKIQFF